ncbi:MAG: hypothetical protein IH614_20520 [Desulfuromonadales bacterium]|nr:hypothetical protein [Desulfuromonadales bacterium]
MKNKRFSILLSVLLAAPLVLTGCGSDSEERPVANDRVELAGQYTGPDACALCHPGVHQEWEKSWHTLKAGYGPAFAEQNAGLKNIRPWSLNAAQSDWNDAIIAGNHNVAILDSVGADPTGGLSQFRQENTGTFRNTDIILSSKTYKPSDVSIVIGQTRKQRYAVYYDGSAQTEGVYLAYSRNGGIRHEIMTEETWNRMDGAALPAVQNSGNPFTGDVVDNGTGERLVRQGGTLKLFNYSGNKERAGYKFLFTEVFLYPGSGGYATASSVSNVPRLSGDNYNEWRSWQERCIGCHTTGFDYQAWDAAKADFMAGNRADLKDIFVADIRVSCEACHGPGARHARTAQAEHIIHPDKLTGEHRLMVCEQCHTRTQKNLHEPKNANDNRGFILGHPEQGLFQNVMEYTRPNWGAGNRQVSNDGKGRRDHQQSMDIRLSEYIHLEVENRPWSNHGGQACFDCHTSHSVGNTATLADTARLTTANDPDGRLRLLDTRYNMCAGCHEGKTDILAVFNATTGLNSTATGPTWTNPTQSYSSTRGRGDKKQHLFSTVFNSVTGKNESMGIQEKDYVWAVKGTEVRAIWPWEREQHVEKGYTIRYGAKPTL